jgi:hypothetical protein
MTERERIENYLQMSIDYLNTLKNMEDTCRSESNALNADFKVIEFMFMNTERKHIQCSNVFVAARELELPVEVKQDINIDDSDLKYTAYMEYNGYVFYSLHTWEEIDREERKNEED